MVQEKAGRLSNIRTYGGRDIKFAVVKINKVRTLSSREGDNLVEVRYNPPPKQYKGSWSMNFIRVREISTIIRCVSCF